MSAWTDFCEQLAEGDAALDIECVKSRINSRALISWAAEEAAQDNHQFLSDIVEQLPAFDAQLARECIVAKNPQSVLWRIFHDSIVRMAAKDALYTAESEREDRAALEAPFDEPMDDPLKTERRRLARFHNYTVKP